MKVRLKRLFNTHLASDDNGDEGTTQAQRLRMIIDAHGQHPAVIAGDFNDHQRPDIVDILNAEHNQDAWTNSTSRSRNGLTNPTKSPCQRLDHILVPHTIAVEHVEVPDTNNDWTTMSDHLPVIATINLAQIRSK